MGADDQLPRRREALLREIVAHGVTHGTAEKPILSRDGRDGISWVMSFLGVGLREPWLSTASDLLLDALDDFDTSQIATMGMAASPLLAGCVLRSGGACNALLVRAEPKPYGSGRQIEGLPDRGRPVVIVDDAIGTGHSALKCAGILEADGFEVAGVVALVRFTYDSGYGLLEERGLRVRALYDLYDDFLPIMQPDGVPDDNPWRARDIRWRDEAAPEGLSPFALARRYLGEARDTGTLSRPPRTLAGDIASPGGMWISARDGATGAPVARNGVWRFGDELSVSTPGLLAEACWRLARGWPDGGPEVAECGLGLSLVGPLTPCTPGEADDDAFGLVCRSRERRWQIGSALPRMPGILSAAHQLRHALFANGALRPREPFDLFRCTVTKLVEPGARWPQGGRSAVPRRDPAGRDAMAAAILRRARAAMTEGAVEGGEGGKGLFFFDAAYLFLALYDGAGQRACLGRRCADATEFDTLVEAAMRDGRMAGVDPAGVSIQLSVLSDGWSEPLPPAFTPGRHALGLTAGGRESILLPGVAVDENLDADGFAALLHRKAGSPVADLRWSRYAVEQWQAGPEGRAAPSHPSAWVTARPVGTDPLDGAARRWFLWLAEHMAAGTLPGHDLPWAGERGDAASAAVYAEAIRRLREAAPVFGLARPPLPLDLLPRAPDVLTLAHAHAAAGGMAARLRTLWDATAPRYDPVGFWRGAEALEAAGERTARWRHAPVATHGRIVRLCADPEAAEAAWLAGTVDAGGAVISNETDAEDTLVAARAAEALARSDGPVAGRILTRLARQSVDLGAGRAAIRASDLQSGLRTEHTVAALGAFARLRGAAP